MKPAIRKKLTVVSFLAGLTGLLTIGSTLAAIAHSRHHLLIVIADAHLTIIAGLSLVYLATLLRRGKYNAWLIALPVYAYLIVRNYQHFIIDVHKEARLVPAALNLLLPVASLGLLILFRASFQVRSSIQSFAVASRRAAILLLIAFFYGIGGFLILDDKDFHQELNAGSAAHYTIDQFNLTTNNQLVARTRRATIFMDSLAVVSFAAIVYAGLSFFSPIRYRLRHPKRDYDDFVGLLERYGRNSEDYFKLWPRDKTYFFNKQRSAALAYRTVGGCALVVGEPVGPPKQIKGLVTEFESFCWVNDWRAAIIYADDKKLSLYASLGFEVQKIGEEAIIDTSNFAEKVATNKYFRHIDNKFSKLGFDCEYLEPPYSKEVVKELAVISEEWLSRPGRTERGFMMGYFSEAYLQQCRVVVVKDRHGRIQAFLNQIPLVSINEANFDFLRHKSDSPGNINDFLLLFFIKQLSQQQIPKLNMGLAPLAGLEKAKTVEGGLVNSFLNFAYSNGNRFYSFEGLKRFKSKYEPDWQSRYIIFRGGTPGFTKVINSLIRAMRLGRHLG